MFDEMKKISKEYDLIIHLEETVFTENGIDYFYNFHMNGKEIFHMIPFFVFGKFCRPPQKQIRT